MNKTFFDRWLLWLVLTTLTAIAVSVICLSSGVVIVFQNIFYLPIVIATARYKRIGFYYSLALSVIYLSLIVGFTNNYYVQLASLIRVGAFIIVAAVITYLASRLEENQIAISRSREQYKALVANIPGVTYSCLNDEEWTMQFIGKEITRLTGYPVSDFIDNAVRSYASIIHPEDRLYVKREILEAIAKKNPFTVDYRIITSDNRTIWVAERGRGVIDSYGSIESLEGVIIDVTESKDNYFALRESRELLKATLNSIGDGVITTDSSGFITNMNKVAEELTGWSAIEAKGKEINQVFKIINAQTGQEAVVPVQKSISEGVIVDLANDTILVSRLGSKRQIGDSCAPIKDLQGQVVGAVLVFRDVTEEYRLNKLISESERRFNQLTAHSHTFVWETDSKGLYTYVSDGLYKVLGYSDDDLIGKKHFYDLHPEEGREEFKNEILQAIERKDSFEEFINPAESKDGKLLWLATNAIPVLDDQGNMIGYRGSDKDVTQRVTALRALAENEAKYRTITEHSFDMISIIDLNGLFLYCNNSYEDILKYKQDELIGTDAFNLIHPEERQQARELLKSGLESGRKEATITHRLRTKKGYYRYINNLIKLIASEDSNFNKMMVIGTDITEQKFIEKSLEYQFSFNSMLANISSGFVKAGGEKLDNQISEALRDACRFFDAERSYIYIMSQDEKSLNQIYHWNDGKASIRDETIYCKMYPWLCQQMKSNPYQHVDMDNLPAEAEAEKSEWLKEGIKEILFFPLSMDEKTVGFIEFDSISKKNVWDKDTITLAGIIAGTISEAIHRNIIEEKVRKSEQRAAALAMVVTTNHEISQPLMVIQGYLEMLHANVDKHSSIKYMDEMQKAIDSIDTILKKMSEIEGIEFTEYVEGTDMVKLPDNETDT